MFLESMRKPVTVTKVLRCQSTSSTLTNCTATGQRKVKDYFYRKEDGVRGAVEEPCTLDTETEETIGLLMTDGLKVGRTGQSI